MDFVKYLEDIKAQKKIDKACKKYKGKRVALYGAGSFADVLFSNYDLSGLNIVAVADKKFEESERKFHNVENCITPAELKTFDCDVILISNQKIMYFWDFLERSLLKGSKNQYVPVKPLLQFSYFEYFIMLMTHKI